MAKQPSQEYIFVNVATPRPYRWSTGRFMGRLYREAKDNKKLVTNRSPKCHDFLWPPAGFCGRCKVEAGDDWVELSDTGTALQYTLGVRAFWDPHEGREWVNPHPVATILLDTGIYIYHFLEETDPKKLKPGMRVRAVWKEKPDGEGLLDILYFRAIEEQEAKK